MGGGGRALKEGASRPRPCLSTGYGPSDRPFLHPHRLGCPRPQHSALGFPCLGMVPASTHWMPVASHPILTTKHKSRCPCWGDKAVLGGPR